MNSTHHSPTATRYSLLAAIFAATVMVCGVRGQDTPSSTTSSPTPDSFASGNETLSEWQPERGCRVVVGRESVAITATGEEPRFFRRFEKTCGQVDVSLRFRTRTASNAVVQWVTKQSPRRSDDKQIVVPLIADGQWHSYPITIPVFGVLYGISIKLTAPNGTWDFGTGTLTTATVPPLFLVRAVPAPWPESSPTPDPLGRARLTLTNISPTSVTFEPADLKQSITLLPEKVVTMQVPTKRVGALRTASLALRPIDHPPITFTVAFYDDAGVQWTSLPVGALAIRAEGGNEEPLFTLEVAQDGTAARLQRLGTTVAVLAPLATLDNEVCTFTARAPQSSAGVTTLSLTSPQLKLDLQTDEAGRVSVSLQTQTDAGFDTRTTAPLVVGPRLRLFGPLQRGMLAGVEALAAGDVSSSPIDIEPPKQRRRDPRPAWITMPLAALASDSATITLAWNDLTLQPSFSSPDFVEDRLAHAVSLASDHIASKPMTLTFRVQDAAASNTVDPIADAVKWYVSERGLPPQTPSKTTTPRTWDEERELCRTGMERLVGLDNASWSYSSAEGEAKAASADFLSMAWRLGGVVPKVAAIEHGGGDIGNESIYFVTARAAEWRDSQLRLVQGLIADLKNESPDGVFLYRTRFPDVESASSSIGYDAMRLGEMMTQVLVTNDQWLSMRVDQGLAALKDVPIPRGGFYRETTLHTPDILSAASLCRLFTAAYRRSKRDDYLEAAVRFALHGLTFVYLRDGESAITNYATVPMLGATDRKFPIWFGVARPQAGLAYADALLDLAEHDTTLDWRQIACGIVATAEKMQFVGGPYVGCVPEYVDLETERASTLAINPADLAQERMRCERLPVTLSILLGRERPESLVSPFPVQWTTSGVEVIGVPAGLKYQLLHKGRDVIDAIGSGSGRDQITIE
ncbi:MAG: hypothetical protein ACRC46_02410 [Thermoguttaceae bacterium]